jgi:hypothetical protein
MIRLHTNFAYRSNCNSKFYYILTKIHKCCDDITFLIEAADAVKPVFRSSV